MQYSLLHKQEVAHEESIWCVAWGRTKNSEEKSDVDMKDPDDAPEKNESEASDFIVTGSLDDTVKIWNVKDNRLDLQKQLSGHSLGVVSVAVSSDGKTIASSSLDSGLCIWKTETGQMLNQAALGPVDLWTVAFSPDDKYVISGSHEGKISLYSVETAKPEQVLDPQNGKFTLSIAYVSESKRIFLDFVTIMFINFSFILEPRRKIHRQWSHRWYYQYFRCSSWKSSPNTRRSCHVGAKFVLFTRLTNASDCL